MAIYDTDVMTNQSNQLRDDIRLLGRILGDTVRRQQGEAVFWVVESIRQVSISFVERRTGPAEPERDAK